MDTLVVYYSMNGNTAYTARKIASALNADLLEIKPVREYPDKGVKKFLWGGKSAVMAETPELQPYEFDPEKYSTVIIGFPVWAGNVAPPIRTFARGNLQALKGKRLAAFACQGGRSAQRAFAKLAALLGMDGFAALLVLNDPKDRPDAGNDAKINEFCDKCR